MSNSEAMFENLRLTPEVSVMLLHAAIPAVPISGELPGFTQEDAAGITTSFEQVGMQPLPADQLRGLNQLSATLLAVAAPVHVYVFAVTGEEITTVFIPTQPLVVAHTV